MYTHFELYHLSINRVCSSLKYVNGNVWYMRVICAHQSRWVIPLLSTTYSLDWWRVGECAVKSKGGYDTNKREEIAVRKREHNVGRTVKMPSRSWLDSLDGPSQISIFRFLLFMCIHVSHL